MYGSDLSNVAMVTVAPELAGAKDAITFLADQGIVVSVGECVVMGLLLYFRNDWYLTSFLKNYVF